MQYKGWNISHNPKPIPTRQFDCDATHEDYDGVVIDEDGNELAFNCRDIEAAKEYIDDMQEPDYRLFDLFIGALAVIVASLLFGWEWFI